MPKSKHLIVLQLLPELNAGGVERGTLEVAQKLVAEGHRSIVISNGGKMVEHLLEDGSEHIELAVHKKSPFTLKQIKPLAEIIDSIQPDIIHVRSRLPAWVNYFALKKYGNKQQVKVISTVHGLYSVNKYSEIMTRADALIAVSKTIKKYLIDNYIHVSEDKIQVIYRGVDTKEFPQKFLLSKQWRECWEQKFPQTHHKIILTLPGRITRLKGHETFIHLINNLKTSRKNIHGLIVGNSHSKKRRYLAALKSLVKELNLEKEITFTGQRNDMKEIYALSDMVFSLSNKAESFGRTVLEPLVMGRKVIGWDHGGVGEILNTLYPIGKVALGDNKKLLDKTIALLDSEQYPLLDNPYTLDKMLDKTIKLYQQVTNNDGIKLA